MFYHSQYKKPLNNKNCQLRVFGWTRLTQIFKLIELVEYVLLKVKNKSSFRQIAITMFAKPFGLLFLSSWSSCDIITHIMLWQKPTHCKLQTKYKLSDLIRFRFPLPAHHSNTLRFGVNTAWQTYPTSALRPTS